MLNFRSEGEVAVITMDDGKANAVSHGFIDSLNQGLDRAEAESKAVVLQGRPGVFSAGLISRKSAKDLLRTRHWWTKGRRCCCVYSHAPCPSLPPARTRDCRGSVIDVGERYALRCLGRSQVWIKRNSDRYDVASLWTANCSMRVSKRHQTQAIIQAKLYGVEEAQRVGFLDEVVSAQELEKAAITRATELAELPTKAYAAMKLDFGGTTLILSKQA